MPEYGKRSNRVISTCHHDLQMIFNEIIKYYDVSALEGIRDLTTQQNYFKNGKSKCDGIKYKSKHQGKKDEKGVIVSYAIDACPYHKGVDMFKNTHDNWKRYYYMAGNINCISETMYSLGVTTHKVRWGGDWNNDDVYHTNEEFTDLPHYELYKPKE